MGLSWKKMSNIEEYTHNIPMSGAFFTQRNKIHTLFFLFLIKEAFYLITI